MLLGFIATLFSGVQTVEAASGSFYWNSNSATSSSTRKYEYMLYAPTGGWTPSTGDMTKWNQYWNNPFYAVKPTSDEADVKRMLRQQIFVHSSGEDYQVKANDGYSGLYKDSNGRIIFQITGSLVPYRYFHTTSDNHRTSILVKVHDSTGKEIDFRHYGTKTLPVDQTGRYTYRFVSSGLIKNKARTAQPANADGTPSNIVPGNYFQGYWNKVGGLKNLPNQADKVCGLGIAGAYLATGSYSTSCNYLYEWSGFQANIDVTNIIEKLAAEGHDTNELKMDFRLVYEQTSVDKAEGVNVTVAPLDIVINLGGAQTQFVNELGKTGFVTLRSAEGSGSFNLLEQQLLRQRITNGVRTLTYSTFPLGRTYYNDWDSQRDTNGFRKRRNFRIENLKEAGGQRGIYFGFKLWGEPTYSYAPNDYFYTFNHTAYLRFTTAEIPPEIDIYTIIANFRNLDAPSQYIEAISPSSRPVDITPDSSTEVSLTTLNIGQTVEDPKVNGREWQFTRSESPTYSREKYTVKSDTGGVYDVLRPENKVLTHLDFYYKRYDTVQIRYEDVHNRGELVPATNNPQTLTVGFNETVSHAAEDEVVDTNGVKWSFVEVGDNKQTQHVTNDQLNGKEIAPLVYYYEPYVDVEVAHRQILRGTTANSLDGINGETLATDTLNVRIGRYAKIDAREDNTLVDSSGRTGYNYVGLVSVDGGTTIRQHKTRTLEHIVSLNMDTIVFYYGIPVGCDTTHQNNITDTTIISCIETNASTSDRKDFVLPYINGYLTKLGNVTQYDAQSSVYVYNYAPIVHPEGVYALRNVTTRAIHGSDTVESTNNKAKIYLSEELNNLTVEPYQALNSSPNIDITLRLANGAVVGQMSDLYDPTFEGNDMSNWTDGLSLTYQVGTDELNTDTGGVRFLLDYTYIDEVRHNYAPSLVYNGRTYIAEYVATSLNFSNQKAVRIDTSIADAAVDYNEYMGTLKNTEYKYSVGFERIPVPKSNRGGSSEPWFNALYERYYETFALQRDGYGSYNHVTKEFEGSDLETQQAIDISNRLYYHNDLNETSLPYVDEATRSDRTDLSNTLTFNSDEMWYLVDEFDNNNDLLANYGVNLEEDVASQQALDSLITSPVNATYLPDLLGDHAQTHRRAIPLVYSGYTGNGDTKGQYFNIETLDLFGVGSDSGIQYVSEDVRTAPTPSTWQTGYTLKSGVFTSNAEQLGREVNRQAEYRDALELMGYEPSDNDKYITTKEGSLYYIPLHNGIGTTHRNRLLIGGLGLNDATLAQEDIITYDKYLYGLGSDAIYTPQREVVEAGREINKSNVHYFLTSDDTKLYDTVPEWPIANGTRMMYTHIIEELLN